MVLIRTALWVVPVADLGGVGRHVLDVARHGIPGWRLVVLCPDGPLAHRLRLAGTAVLTGPVGPADGTRRAAAEVRRIVRALRPRIVHGHLAFADLTVALGTLGSEPTVVTTEHGIADDDLVYHGTRWRSRLRQGAHAVRLRRADAVIAVSRATAETIRSKWHPAPGLAIRVIPNGVDPLDATHPRPGLRILSLSRLAPEKGLDFLVEAFAVLAGEEPEAHLTIAGTGPLESALKGHVSRLGLEERVDLPGFVDAGPALAAADVLVQLSTWENCSYSILDALVHGLGVVATPVGGNPELLPARCLVSREAPDAVAAALRRQGLDVAERPLLDRSWPTVGTMCESIGELYEEVGP